MYYAGIFNQNKNELDNLLITYSCSVLVQGWKMASKNLGF